MGAFLLLLKAKALGSKRRRLPLWPSKQRSSDDENTRSGFRKAEKPLIQGTLNFYLIGRKKTRMGFRMVKIVKKAPGIRCFLYHDQRTMRTTVDIDAPVMKDLKKIRQQERELLGRIIIALENLASMTSGCVIRRIMPIF
jgi:hypothetical protein